MLYPATHIGLRSGEASVDLRQCSLPERLQVLEGKANKLKTTKQGLVSAAEMSETLFVCPRSGHEEQMDAGQRKEKSSRKGKGREKKMHMKKCPIIKCAQCLVNVTQPSVSERLAVLH
ncbi:hypothetical protein E2C01_017313 [Portunus trituberculatus]|uniref:Uncharacterized protein n=1 Tax=Portunus trituberculatus TaxID=210409 RepID=A0A5B7DTF5_PORTR|nr:hypothetical protein [Portunus trituberculatus]